MLVVRKNKLVTLFLFVGEFSPNFDLKIYDFNLYELFSMDKKWPKFARFL
jgi:hypothetical protein